MIMWMERAIVLVGGRGQSVRKEVRQLYHVVLLIHFLHNDTNTA